MGSALSDLARYRDNARWMPVEALSLEDACAKLGVPKFVKMDVEGAEKQVIANSLEFLALHDIEWGIESHHIVDGRLASTDMDELFPRAGYHVLSEPSQGGYFFTWASRGAL